MELEAVVKYRGAFAHYSIEPDRAGVYHAYLRKYDGPLETAPPQRVTLARGIRHWVGSSTQSQLMDEIGAAIDSTLTRNRDIFPGQIAP